jgi:hypothetical protein
MQFKFCYVICIIICFIVLLAFAWLKQMNMKLSATQYIKSLNISVDLFDTIQQLDTDFTKLNKIVTTADLMTSLQILSKTSSQLLTIIKVGKSTTVDNLFQLITEYSKLWNTQSKIINKLPIEQLTLFTDVNGNMDHLVSSVVILLKNN